MASGSGASMAVAVVERVIIAIINPLSWQMASLCKWPHSQHPISLIVKTYKIE